MNIFNIGKANAKITELETELASHKENQTTVEAHAERLQSELTAARSNFDAEKVKVSEGLTKISTLEAAVTAANTKISTLEAAQSEFDAKVKTAASAKAGAILAEVGQPPLKAGKDETPAAPEKSATEGLFGIAKVRAAIKAQLAQSPQQ